MNLLDGWFGVQFELVLDPSELIFDRFVVSLLERFVHRLAPELIRDKFKPVLPVDLCTTPANNFF
jgi:hypothetical protein